MAHSVVTPAPGRVFGTNNSGQDIVALMQTEAGNPILSNMVVHFFNLSPVNATGDSNVDFEQWTGTLISPEWVLTCAHTLQGTNGRGGGLFTGDILYNYGGASFPDPASAAIAEFILHPAWTKDGYTNGNDIALVRLAVPVTNVTTFPRLPVGLFGNAVNVLFAGYGHPGNGEAGEDSSVVGSLGAGLNSLDGVGGSPLTDGFGHAYNAYSNWVSSVAFMDFDKWELAHFECADAANGTNTNSIAAALSALSTMGENEASQALQPCSNSAATAPGYFNASICDFLPAAGDSGGPAFQWNSTGAFPDAGTYFMNTAPTLLGVMSYRSRGINPTNATSVYGNAVAFTLVQPHVGWIHQVTGLGAAGPATFLRMPLDVKLINTRILAERAFGSEETEIEFAMDAQNIDTGRYRDISVYAVTTNLPSSVTMVDAGIDFANLGEMATAPAGADKMVIRVANADLDSARATILSGAAFEITANEEQVFSGPQKYIDKPTDDAFEGTTFNVFGELVLIFTNRTTLIDGLNAGDILIADPTTGAYRPMQPSPTEQFPLPYLSEQIPFEVSSVSDVGEKTHVAGHKREIWEILKSGTFVASDENYNGSRRDLLDPPVENTYTGTEKTNRTIQAAFLEKKDPGSSALADLKGLNAIPWHFNEIKITDHLQLSGQVLLRSSGLRTQLSFRNFALKKASVGIDAGVVASLVLETTGSNNNTSVPIAEKQHEFPVIPLAEIPFTVAGVPCSVGVSFVLSVGAEANAPGGISIPLETSINVGAEIGWTNGHSFTAPIREFVAPHVSDPTVFDAISLSARAWAEARLELDFKAVGVFSAGPSLAIRADAAFEVAPFNDPWWTLDAGADLVGAFEFDFLGLTVARVDATNHLGTFFHADAGGPLISLSQNARTKAATSRGDELAPRSGEDVRWGLAFAAPGAFSGWYSKGFVTPLNDGAYFVGGGHPIISFLGSVSRDGVARWMQHFPQGARPVDGEQLADGSVMVAGYAGHDWWLAKYDTNGTRQWVVSQRLVSSDVRDMAVGRAGNGDPEFYLAGFVNPVIVTQSDPVVMKFDKDGNLLWSKIYYLNNDDEVYAIRALSDGNFALVGSTDSKVGTDLFIGSGNNGLITKISPAGDVLWANAVAGRWGMSFHDVVEAPDGALFVGGSHGDLILNFYPSILAAKFSASGELQNHVLIGEAPDWVDELPNAGDTPYDYVSQMVWTSNGVVIVGATSIGLTTTAFAACLTDELGVRWFSAFDGLAACNFQDIAATDTGLAVLGGIDHAWPVTFTNRSPAWLLSLPWEGMMRFHPSTGIESKYLQPRVYLSSGTSDFLGRFTDANGNLYTESTAPVPFVVSNLVVTAGANITAGVAEAFDTKRLERLESSLVDSFEEWAAYYQLDGTNATVTGDADLDGVNNGTEFFGGTDPLGRTTNSPVVLGIQYDVGGGTVDIDFPRAHAAAGVAYAVEYTTDFSEWVDLPNTAEAVVGSDDLWNWIRITAPQPDPAKAFFRLRLMFD